MTTPALPLLCRLSLVLACCISLIATARAQDGKLVFSSDRADYNYELYLMNLDGTNVERLTYCGARDVEPTMSRDGTKVVFVSFRDEPGGEIYSVNVDGTGLSRLTHNRRGDSNSFVGIDSNPTWSPDGTQIAFYSVISGGTPGLYKMNADGTGLTRLADARPGTISWSPDGSRITYPKTNGNFSDTWMVDADGANPRFLTTASLLRWHPDGSALIGLGRFGGVQLIDPSNGDVLGGVSSFGLTVNAVSLSADGQKVFFSASLDIAKSRLYSANLNGTAVTPLSFATQNAFHPSCGPGKTSAIPPAPTGFGRLLLTSGRDLFTMNPTGWDVRKLPRSELFPDLLYEEARWSPDGSRISFGSGGDIYVMDADGTNVRRITTKPDASYNYEGPASWSPDGQKLAFHHSFRVDSVNHSSIMVLSGFDTATPSSFNLTGTSLPREYWPEWNPQANEILFWVNDDLPRLVRKGANSPIAPELVIARTPDTAVYPNGPYFQRGVWDTTGDRVIFSRSETGAEGRKEELVMTDATGGNLQYLTEHGFGEASDSNPTVSPGSSSSELNVAFTRGWHVHTLSRTTPDPGSPLVEREIRQITFDHQGSSIGLGQQTVHWGSNFDYSDPDETAPDLTIVAPAPDSAMRLTTIHGTIEDPGSEPSGVAIVWVKFQRLSDGKYWNPGASSATEKWSPDAVLLPAVVTNNHGSFEWQMSSHLPPPADAPPDAQYRVSAFAIDAAGNAGTEVTHTFTRHEAGTLSLGSATIKGYESVGYVDIPVRREGGSNGPVTVEYQASAYVAIEGEDFTGGSGVLEFADGETEKSVRITILQDEVSEGREEFYLSLTNASGGAEIGSIRSQMIVLLEAPLGIALDASGMTWSTGSTDPFTGGWWTTSDVSQSGGSAAVITPSFAGTDSWLETSVSGPGTLTFYWKVSSGAAGDRLAFLLDEAPQGEISGEVGWRKHTLQIPAGAHVLRWSYSTQSGGFPTGQNTAWLDSVQFTAGPGGGDGEPDPDPEPDVRAFAGTYQGLIQSAPASSLSSGFVSLKVTKQGTFTGKLTLGRTKIPLQGSIDAAGIATLKAQKAKFDIGLQLDFNAGEEDISVSGTAIANDGSSLSLAAYRVPVYTSPQSSPYAGNYTVLLSLASDDGTGYGTMKVSRTGGAKLALTLPDGTRIAHAASISADGRWPLYGTSGKRLGALAGWVEFQEVPQQSDFGGELDWFTFSQDVGREVATSVTLQGSRYTPPADGSQILPSLPSTGAAMLSLADGPLADPILLDVTFGEVLRGKVPFSLENDNPHSLKLKVNAKKGTFNGSYKLPDIKKRIAFGGVLFQKQERAAGFHQTGGNSGAVELMPPPAM